MIPPMDLDPSPIVPEINLYPSDFIIDHLILHDFSNNLIFWQLLIWFLAYFYIFYDFFKIVISFFREIDFFDIFLINILNFPLKYP